MLWYCTGCTTAYSPGAPRCPHCGSEKHSEGTMPKVTREGVVTSASDVQDEPEAGQETAPDAPEAALQDDAAAAPETAASEPAAPAEAAPQDVTGAVQEQAE